MLKLGALVHCAMSVLTHWSLIIAVPEKYYRRGDVSLRPDFGDGIQVSLALHTGRKTPMNVKNWLPTYLCTENSVNFTQLTVEKKNRICLSFIHPILGSFTVYPKKPCFLQKSVHCGGAKVGWIISIKNKIYFFYILLTPVEVMQKPLIF